MTWRAYISPLSSFFLIKNTAVGASPAKNKILKEGWLQYSVMGMNSKKWFVLCSDDTFLSGYTTEDKNPGNSILYMDTVIDFF